MSVHMLSTEVLTLCGNTVSHDAHAPTAARHKKTVAAAAQPTENVKPMHSSSPRGPSCARTAASGRKPNAAKSVAQVVYASSGACANVSCMAADTSVALTLVAKRWEFPQHAYHDSNRSTTYKQTGYTWHNRVHG
jgi:hypothetical protein